MISQSQINDIVQRIVFSYKPQKIYLFGSYARGIASENSDLDLLVLKDTHRPPHQRGNDIAPLLKGILFPIDILIYNQQEMDTLIKDKYSFLYHAIQDSKILYEQK